MIHLLLGCQAIELPEHTTLSWSWKKIDPHVHSSLGSNDTDGAGIPSAIEAAMNAAQLDYIILTDHSNSQGSMECEDVEMCPNQGPELTPAARGTRRQAGPGFRWQAISIQGARLALAHKGGGLD